MTTPQRVADMATYLAATGWRRRPETWREASLWQGPDGYEVLVPARDGLDDAAERTWELLQTLAKVEGRSPDAIAEDIASPETDAPYIRTFPSDLPSGHIGLTAGVRAIEGVRGLLEAAGRAELESVQPRYTGRVPSAVREVVEAVALGPSRPGSYILPLRISVKRDAQWALLTPLSDKVTPHHDDEAIPLARRVLVRLCNAVYAVRQAVMQVREGGDYSAFDATVGEGVSANLCQSLSDLGGLRRSAPFEIGFRWARDLPSTLAATTVSFPEGSGMVAYEAAKQLERLAAGGEAQIVGEIEGLHDEPRGVDRWRIRVRGQLYAEGGGIDPHRPVWVRLSQLDYERAIEAHREHRTVRARGRLELSQRRVELSTHPGGFEVL